MIQFAVALLLSLPLLAGFFACWLFLSEWRKDQALRRYQAIRRFNPDRNGNYPAFFDPRTGTHFIPNPGNGTVPAQILMYNGVQRDIKPSKEHHPLIINYNRRPPIESIPVQVNVDDQELDQPVPIFDRTFEPENLLVQPVQPEQAGTENQLRALLLKAKQEGRAMTVAIPDVIGCRRGNSKEYLYWKDVWLNLPNF